MRYPLLLTLLFTVTLLYAGDEKKKVQQPRVEDALRRAVIKAKSYDSLKFKRANVLNSEVDDDCAFVVVIEFGTSDLGIFQGNEDPAKDQFVLIDSKDAKLLTECAARSYK